jgi:magnesium-transporting ATPase (P-type)
VFARVTPHQKLQIVEAAQRAGHFVAVTGDGANDAPALRAANIGVAMGKSGTDIAREAAGLVISDDTFSSIVIGVEEGRIAYDNVRKVIFLLISTGLAELVLVILSVATRAPLPLTAAQLLWLNLITNGIQDVALACEPGQGDELSRPPRPAREPVFDRTMTQRTLLAGVVMGSVAFAVFQLWLGGENRAGSGGPDRLAAARNATLLLMVFFENIHIGNCRSETRSIFTLSPLRSPFLLGAVAMALAVHVAAMHLPAAQTVLGTAPLAPAAWLGLLLTALVIIPPLEILKWWERRSRQGG